MEDEYEYTVALESPCDPDMNTDVLEVCESAQQSGDQMEDHCENEVALDSDDEGGSQNKAVHLMNGRFPAIGRLSGRNVSGLLRRRQSPAGYFQRLDNMVSMHLDSDRSEKSDGKSTGGRTSQYDDNRFQEDHAVVDGLVSSSPEQKPIPDFLNLVRESLGEESLDAKKLSPHEPKSMDMENNANFGCKGAEFTYVKSPAAEESQDKALRFVDHFLSVNDLNSYNDIPTRKTIMTKSPPSLRSKGSQNLARRVSLGSSPSKLKTFDWAENQIKKDKYTSRMNKDWIFGFEDDKSGGCLSSNQESDNGNLHNKISNLQSKETMPGSTLSLYDLTTNSLNAYDTDNVGSNSVIRVAYESMELDKQPDVGLSMQTVEKAEDFSLVPDAFDIGLDTQVAAEAMEELIHAVPPRFDVCLTHQGSDNTVFDNKCESNHDANYEETFVGWSFKGKRSKCVKMSTVQDKNVSWLAAKQFEKQRGTFVTKNAMTEKLMNGEFLNSRNLGNKRNRKYGFTEQCSLKDFQKHHCLCDRRSKETTDIKSGSSLKLGEMISFQKDVHSSCNSKVKTGTERRVENSNLDVDRTLSKLNMWVCPKGKRARQRTPRHSFSSSNECSPSAAIENNMEKYPTANEEAQNGVPQLLVYKRRRKLSLKQDQIGSSLELTVDLSSPVNDNAVSDKRESIGSDTGKPLMQGGILDDWKPSSLDASINIKTNLMSNEHSMNLQVLEGSNERKEQFRSPLMTELTRLGYSESLPDFLPKDSRRRRAMERSPLMTELTRLGYSESLPDFLPKDSRRRRAMEKVCVLFSQHLETSTLKQQKKIVARLGLSTASSCSTATHFVADRFTRTMNMLEAIALGKHVVTHLWLESCVQAGRVVDEKSYILRDEKKEKEIGFSMPISLSRARKFPLLKGHRVLITPNVKPGKDVINSLVKAVQGEVVPNIPAAKTKDKLIPDDYLIISSKEDYTICLQYLEKGASVYDSELLLNGIVTQKLDYERCRLFEDFKENIHP